ILHPDNNSLISGISLFGVQLQKKLEIKGPTSCECTRLAFEDLSNYCYNPEDELTLNSMTFTVGIQKDSYQIDFGK
ncbi:2235_t:CDS:2, partial [Funneliformis geosporum]